MVAKGDSFGLLAEVIKNGKYKLVSTARFRI
jgi:hypothetical protein